MGSTPCAPSARGNRIPAGALTIVALTAHAMKGDREICMQAGMDDYLGKPIHPMELWAVIERWRQPRPEAHPDAEPALR